MHKGAGGVVGFSLLALERGFPKAPLGCSIPMEHPVQPQVSLIVGPWGLGVSNVSRPWGPPAAKDGGTGDVGKDFFSPALACAGGSPALHWGCGAQRKGVRAFRDPMITETLWPSNTPISGGRKVILHLAAGATCPVSTG